MSNLHELYARIQRLAALGIHTNRELLAHLERAKEAAAC
ncbi:Uncharacterised protein [Aquipseudomonas alcaligenes]|nr:Uncharacterised protein [Pseudomonas alcaligenes]